MTSLLKFTPEKFVRPVLAFLKRMNEDLKTKRRNSQGVFSMVATPPEFSGRRRSILELKFLNDVAATDTKSSFRKPHTSTLSLDFVQYVEAIELCISSDDRGCPEAQCALGYWYIQRFYNSDQPKPRSSFFAAKRDVEKELVEKDVLLLRAERCYFLAGGLPCALSRLGCMKIQQSTYLYEKEGTSTSTTAVRDADVLYQSRKLLNDGFSLLQKAANCGFEEAINVLVHLPLELPLKEDSDKFEPVSKTFWETVSLSPPPAVSLKKDSDKFEPVSKKYESMQLQPGSITVTSDIWGVAEVSAILSCAIGNVAAVQSIIFSKEAFTDTSEEAAVQSTIFSNEAFGDTFEEEESVFSLFD